jgi:hypothetical protein
MHVVAHHRITDPIGFNQRAEEPVSGRPLHWRLILCLPARDGSACFCLWWSDSPESLRRFLERTLGDVCTVECHEVDEEDALGLAGPAGLRLRLERGV